jgi:hypothetical protein
MTPASVLREQLATARREGLDFDAAWPAALAVALAAMPQSRVRSEWARALADIAPVWRRAFERRPATGSEAAMVLLAQTRRPGGVRVVP